MPGIESVLDEIERLVRNVRIQDADAKLRGLLHTMGEEQVREWEIDLRRTIARFLPKRRRALDAELDRRLRRRPATGTTAAPSNQPQETPVDLLRLERDLANGLEDLKEHHIFQWSTYYRDFLSPLFTRTVDAAAISAKLTEDTSAMVRRALSSHSREIFAKGYAYVRAQRGKGSYALTKSLGGLQRFLELPIEFYSAKQADLASGPRVVASRCVTSALLSGILEGYGDVTFGELIGWQVLPRLPRSWAHVMAFLTATDCEVVLGEIEPGDFKDGVQLTLLPLIGALDDLIQQQSDYSPVPALGQFDWEARRIDIALRPPKQVDDPQLWELFCFSDPAFATRIAIEEASRRNAVAIVAPLRADLSEFVTKDERLNRLVVGGAQSSTEIGVCRRRIKDVLELAFYARRSPRVGATPLSYNLAREFPIHNPFLTKYYHVYRPSVRDLMRTFERRNGVRLWCSVRRSGKTTACFDLGATTGHTLVVSQTCADTEQSPGSSHFYDLVVDALAGAKSVGKTFFRDSVAECAGRTGQASERYVFVLDEYETLFGRLGAAGRDPGPRYAVVQPLLNQMVGFARDNLLVFMGQQPNAHFILMDQNQLSAYVEQDAFPLFEHSLGAATGEFSELLSKVMTDRVNLQPSFVDAVFEETAGHPFLTVKVLVALVDWLIEEKRPLKELHLSRGDFERFASRKLRQDVVSASPEYTFFREAVAQATSDVGRVDNPWLYAVYTSMRELVRGAPDSFRCTVGDFGNIVERVGGGGSAFSASQILSTGVQANFFRKVDEFVEPKIRLLGRIAGVTAGWPTP